MEGEKKQKYSEVTGEKLKKKSVRKIKKEHKAENKKNAKQTKKFAKKKEKVDKKLNTSEQNQTAEIAQEKTNQTKVLIVRKQSDAPVTPGKKFLSFISYFLVGLVAVFFGYISGNFYIANVLNKVDYSAFSEESLRPDARAIYLDLLDSDIQIARCNPADLFVVTEYLLDNSETYSISLAGNIQPNIASTQILYGIKQKQGNMYYAENVSKGIISVGEKSEYNAETEETKIYKAVKISGTSAQYEENPSVVYSTLADYRNEYGTYPTTSCNPYIINSQKTVVEGSEKVELIGANRYRISFSLATDSSVINYIKQMKHMSGLKDYPTFKAINVSAIIEYNRNDVGHEFKFTYARFDEAYTVMYFGVMATCTGYLEYNFTY